MRRSLLAVIAAVSALGFVAFVAGGTMWANSVMWAGAATSTQTLAGGDSLTVNCTGSQLNDTQLSGLSRQLDCVAPTTTTTVPPTTTTSQPPPTTTTTAPLPPPSGLSVSGDKILRNGVQQQQHGVNFSGFEYACSEGWGMNDGPSPPTQAEINGMKAWNVNTVRLPLNEDCWLGIHGVRAAYAGANYQTAVANWVNLLTSNGVAVDVNLHFSGDGVHKANGQEPMADRADSPSFWSSVAARFASNPLVMFEPFNEPHDITWACWQNGGCTVQGSQSGDGTFVAAGMQDLVTAIRNTGATNPIVVTGENWASDLSGWQTYKPTDPAGQLIAGWHSYGDGLSCQDAACWNTTLASVLTTNPILATEIGEFDCAHSYIDQVTNWLDAHDQQGYYAWTWGPFNCSGDPALLGGNDWNGGTATNSYGTGYKAHLLTRP